MKKPRQALDSEQSFVFGEISFDGYFWKLRKCKFISLPSLPVSVWQTDFFTLFCVLDGAEMSSTGWAVLTELVVQIARQDSQNTAPNRGCLLFPRRPIEGSGEY